MTGRAASLLALALTCHPLVVAMAQAAPGGSGTLKLTGYLQPRFMAVGNSAAFLLRRARVAVEGQITPWASFRAQVELRTIGAPAIPATSPLTLSATDLFIKLSHRRWEGTVGQFRVPFSLESLLSSTTLETTERSRVVFAAKRDIGAQLAWGVPDRLLLQGAVVNGDGPNRATNADNRMAYFVRAVVTPVSGLDVGGAFEGYSDSTGLDVQGRYQGKRWRARAEYLSVRSRATSVRSQGWYGLVAFLVGPPRLQLVGRVEQYDPSDQAGADRVTGASLGAQYFIQGDNLKLVADYEVFREQVVQLDDNRAVVQMQVRW